MSTKTNAQYFCRVYHILKAIAFHEIYMQNCREELCNNLAYDPLSAFKNIDTFLHNSANPYEIRSFLELKGIQVSNQEAQAVLRSVNQGIHFLTFDDFLELTMPQNQELREQALNRFKEKPSLTIQSIKDLTSVKQHTSNTIAQFLTKELNFHREYLFMRQEFCRDYGGDIYSLLQYLFKGKHETINYADFFEAARKYKVIFNQSQFTALWRRSKSSGSQEVLLRKDEMYNLLLVHNFNTKPKYYRETEVPFEKMYEKPIPSYQLREYRDVEFQIKNQQEEKQLQEVRIAIERPDYELKYPFVTSPRTAYDLMSKEQQLYNRVNKMDKTAINAKYQAVNPRYPLFH